MKYDLLDQARAKRDALLRDHRSVVSKAAAAYRASKAKLEAAQKRVRDLELSAISAEAAVRAEQRRAR